MKKIFDAAEAKANFDRLLQRAHEGDARGWREQHAGYIEAYNQTLESDGLPLEEWKRF